MADNDESKLVLYAQMANLIKLVLPLMEINIKEVVENFSRVRILLTSSLYIELYSFLDYLLL